MTVHDPNDIQSGLVRGLKQVLFEVLPDTLTVEQKPVIKLVTKGIRPDYPYVTVDQITGDKEGSWLKYQKVDDETGLISYFYERTYTYSVKAWGDDCLHILSTLQRNLAIADYRLMVNNETDTSYQYSSDINQTPTFLETDFVKTASITCTFTALDTVIPPTSTWIEHANVDGNLKGNENDENPLNTTTNV